ncbi:hypothetical protein CHLRE_02g095075v5 [Chlamydomonas reinhardtii]|uniref:Uncharacterized protein n=1 Tax=Chlamydomonas reinhardtii TaxID=3055 RepID=A8JG40_CHLRE|nr:uncharacterized protein CHLRE_02g095075v5 [Chlamydomonas reinhardtii]PNW86688.1 hypothetical protein CHLRE_02g095075v5 [Chlamydomonas reinhardtii]|eukprot:XP_001702156.1 predicted protein [Chlamydomonas reinhardtii]
MSSLHDTGVHPSLKSRINASSTQLDQLAAEIAELHELHAKSHRFRLCKLASKILLVASGEPFLTSAPFKSRGVSDPSTLAVAAALETTAQDFIAAADGIVARHNRAIRPHEVDELDEAVEEMTCLITPALEKMAQWECIVVKNYAAIRSAFSASFNSKAALAA